MFCVQMYMHDAVYLSVSVLIKCFMNFEFNSFQGLKILDSEEKIGCVFYEIRKTVSQNKPCVMGV